MKKSGLVLGLICSFVTVLAFQNCAKKSEFATLNKETSEKIINDHDVIIDEKPEARYYHLQYKKTDPSGLISTILDVSIVDQQIMTTVVSNSHEKGVPAVSRVCEFAEKRRDELKFLLHRAKICDYRALLPKDAMTCMGMALPDLTLTNYDTKEQVELSRNYCFHGLYLCDGVDEKVRSILDDVLENLPASCAK